MTASGRPAGRSAGRPGGLPASPPARTGVNRSIGQPGGFPTSPPTPPRRLSLGIASALRLPDMRATAVDPVAFRGGARTSDHLICCTGIGCSTTPR
eukprot:6442602-Alexandrium_andersonii.AAC.1